MSFLEIENICKTYPGSDVACVNGLCLSVEKGEILSLLGSSGCGKTTVLKMIAGLEIHDSGSIRIDGEPMNGVPPEKRRTAMVFQKPLLFRNMTVGQNVDYAPRVKNALDKTSLKERRERMLDLVDLSGYSDKKATELSGGQEQRVSLARALMTEPKILLLDEPFSALDAKLRIEMRKSVRELCKSLGLTVIFVTHDQQEAVAMGDKVALMMDGKLMQIGTPDAFYNAPATVSVASFFGWRNLLPGEATGDIVETALGSFPNNGKAHKGRCVLAIRPEAAVFNESGKYEGFMESVSYMGLRSECTISCNNVRLEFSIPSNALPPAGRSVKFDIDEKMTWSLPPEEEATATTIAVEEKGNGSRLFKIMKRN